MMALFGKFFSKLFDNKNTNPEPTLKIDKSANELSLKNDQEIKDLKEQVNILTENMESASRAIFLMSQAIVQHSSILKKFVNEPDQQTLSSLSLFAVKQPKPSKAN